MAAKTPTTKKSTTKKSTRTPKKKLECKKYTSAPITIDASTLPPQFTRADLEFHGVDHSEASYEARVFLNNPSADESTELTQENGYVGSFHIFGHGGCFGDVGHCDSRSQRAYDPRPSHPLLPIKKVLMATDAIKQAMTQGSEITITVVPVLMSWTEKCEDLENVLKFDQIKLVAYN